jgi:hypothetical protein
VAARAGTHRRGHKQMETHVNFERRRQHFPGANFLNAAGLRSAHGHLTFMAACESAGDD